MKFGRTETKDAVSSETSHGVSNSRELIIGKFTVIQLYQTNNASFTIMWFFFPKAGYNIVTEKHKTTQKWRCKNRSTVSGQAQSLYIAHIHGAYL